MTEPIDGSEHVSRDAAGRLRYTPPVRSLRPWSTLVVVMIAVTTGLELAELAASRLGLQLALFSRGTDNWELAKELAVGITLVTVWCVWQHAAATNLARRLPEAQRFTPARGVWAWFIPFLNLVRPAYVILDLWRGSQALVPCDGPQRPASSNGIVLIVMWWVAHLAPVLTIPLWFIMSAAPGVDGPLSAIDEFAIPLAHAVLACVIVHRITRMQDAWVAGDADADPA